MSKFVDRLVNPDYTVVIAEAGSNHNNDLDLAKKLIDTASRAGADAVKFQVFRADDLFVDDRHAEEESSYEIVKKLELPYKWIPELHDYCQEQGINFLATPFDRASADRLESYVPAFKVASFTLSHHDFLRHLATKNKPIVFSTGAHTREEIEQSHRILQDAGVNDLVALHCISSYPTELDNLNLRALETLQDLLDVPVGLSDHTMDYSIAPTSAVALGATVIEKHYTLDRALEGPDHSFALEPEELQELVETVRQTKRALGDGQVGVRETEHGTRQRAQRTLVADETIDAGEPVTREVLRVLRPGARPKGIPASKLDEVIGKTLRESLEEGDILTERMLDESNNN